MNTHEEAQLYLGSINQEVFKPLSCTLDRERLKEVCNENKSGAISELETLVSRALQELAYAEGYLMARGASGEGDKGHSSGVQEGKRLLKKVRGALGFTQP